MIGKRFQRKTRQIQESLVYRVDFQFRGELLKSLHHAAAQVAVKRVVAGKYGNFVILDQWPDFEIGITHSEAKGFRLVAPSDYAAVIVRQDHNRPIGNGRVEEPFA